MREFNKFYEEVIKKEEKELEDLRKKESKKMLLIFIGIFITFIIFMSLPIVAMVVFTIFMLYIGKTLKSSKNYVVEFKEKIIRKMVLEFEEFNQFSPVSGIPANIYKMGDFERYDCYKSEDFIGGKLLDKYPIRISEVRTEKESTDEEGNTTTTVVFNGLFSQIEIPININGYVHIHSDKGIIGKMFGTKDKIEMDSSEFEKNFDVRATDKILAMQVLTSDVMDTLLNFIKQYKIKYEITVKKDSIFMRFKTGPMFEPKIQKKALDYETLKRYYNILQFIIKVSEEILKSVERTQ